MDMRRIIVVRSYRGCKAMKEFIHRCWKSLVAIPAVIGVVGGIMAVPGYVATPADLKALKTEVIERIELDRDLQKLNNANETLYRLKIQQRQYPKDKDIATDIDAVRAEKEKLQQRLEKR